MRSRTWRLLVDPPARGAWNMAVDQAVLEAAGAGEVPATLRLYAWEPACLSLGYAQHSAEADLERLAPLGWDLVRRPTGGRALLHVDELTYSVTGPQSEPALAGSVLESYRRLAAALLDALRRLGLPAESRALESGARQSGPVCFEVPSDYEITVWGKKLVGSAQRRRAPGVLQHGSLPLTGDLRRVTHALVFPGEAEREAAAQRLMEHAATVETLLGRTPSWESAAQAFVDAFSQVLDVELRPGRLTDGEAARAQELLQEKYANPAWTHRM